MKKPSFDSNERESKSLNIRTLISVTIGLVLLLGFLSYGTQNETPSAVLSLDDSPTRVYSYSEIHAPISIIGDDDFNDTAFAEGWEGNGTAISPFVIEGLEIDKGGSSGHGILIIDTTAHFIISGCNLTGASVPGYAGIMLSNVTNGEIRNNTISDNRRGVGLNYCQWILIENNTITGDEHCIGINCLETGNITIFENDILGPGFGIIMTDSSENVIRKNFLTGAEEAGIDLTGDTYYNTVTENVMKDSSSSMYISASHNNISRNNLIGNVFFSGTGINNSLSWNNMSGVYAVHSSSNNFTWNHFKSGSYSDSSSVQSYYRYNYFAWYSGYDENQDGIGDTPVIISGTAGSSDPFPLMNPHGTNVTWLDSPSNQAIEEIEMFSYDVDATASPPGIDTWSIDDENNFSIDSMGTITNDTILSPGNYDIQVWVSDTLGNTITGTFTLSVTDASPPTWNPVPSNQIVEQGTNPICDLDASDYSGIHSWWLNDTLNFNIDSQGTITNITTLTSGEYGIQVWINDTLGYATTANFTITVIDGEGPVISPSPTTQYVDPGFHLHYDLNATDLSGVNSWWIDDTYHFSIDGNGVITSNFILPEGIYGIQVWVNDILGHATHEVFDVHVVRTVKVVVLYGLFTSTPQNTPWEHLNQFWSDYGTTRLVIDYTSLAYPGITLQDIRDSGADVLVMSYSTYLYTQSELTAILTYVEEGHGLYVSYMNIFTQDGIWEFLGMRESAPTYDTDSLDESFSQICSSHPIFYDIPSSFMFYVTLSYQPSGSGWTSSSLDGAVILASSSHLGTILTYHGMIYCSGLPEYMPSDIEYTSVQLLYNIFAWSNYTEPQHQLSIDLDAPSINQMDDAVLLNLTIYNRGISDETDLFVELFIDGTLLYSTTIPWIGYNSSTVVQYSWIPTSEGFFNLTAVVSLVPGEELTCDNVFVRVVWAGDIKYVLWDMAHSNDGPTSYSYLLSDLELIGFDINEFWDSEINASVLSQYNILVITQPRVAYSSIELTAIHDFVMNGGGLIVIGDYDETIMDSLTSFAGFNWTYIGSGGLGGPIDVAHPVTLGAVSCWFPSYGLNLNVTWPAIGLRDTYSGLHVFGAAQIGSGKVVCISDDKIFTDSYIEEDSNFIMARNSFTWTSFAARAHDVMAHAKVFELNVRFSNNPITISVLNLGTNIEDYVIVRMFINDQMVFADVIDSLNTSTLVEYDFLWRPLESGFFDVIVTVDSVPGEDWLSDNVHSSLTEVIDWFIEILSDDDFETQGWPGSGTLEDPYRIENLRMLALRSFSPCIEIKDTTAYFIISNCDFAGEDIEDHSGINLWNVTNGQILNNTFTHCRYGIYGRQVYSSVIANNTFRDSWRGVFLEHAEHTIVTQNIFENNDEGTIIYRSYFTIFENNTLQNNINGLWIEYRSNETEVRWNTFIDNIQNAIDDGEFDIFYENYWSNYTGIDADFDGYGDTSHPIPGLAGNLDTHPIAIPFEGPYVTWDEIPTDLFFDHGVEVSVQLYASSFAGIDSYWLNDTTYFVIDAFGLLSNSSLLPFGAHALEIRVYDGYGHYCSAVITIFVDDESSPEWVVDPTLQVIELGDAWTYDLDAMDISGLDIWWLNDTLRFSIDSDGVISMAYLLQVGTYWLQVTVNDTAGNSLIAIFAVQIQDTQAPEWAYPPGNQQIPYGVGISYPVSAIDLSGIDYYWINDTINFAIDGGGTITNLVILDCGIYGLEIRAYDFSGYYCEAVIEISIADGTLPSIDRPADIAYDEGDVGSSITWHPLDDNPVRYEIWRDDVLLRSGDWNSSSESISINVDGLSAGVYVYTLIVVDYGEHATSDSVLVRVYGISTTTTTTTTTTSETTTTETSTTTTTESSSTTSAAPPLEMMSLVIGLSVGILATSMIIILVLVRKGLIRKT